MCPQVINTSAWILIHPQTIVPASALHDILQSSVAALQPACVPHATGITGAVTVALLPNEVSMFMVSH